jgi:hypothetical protein
VHEVKVVDPLFNKEKTGETEDPQILEGTFVMLPADASS